MPLRRLIALAAVGFAHAPFDDAVIAAAFEGARRAEAGSPAPNAPPFSRPDLEAALAGSGWALDACDGDASDGVHCLGIDGNRLALVSVVPQAVHADRDSMRDATLEPAPVIERHGLWVTEAMVRDGASALRLARGLFPAPGALEALDQDSLTRKLASAGWTVDRCSELSGDRQGRWSGRVCYASDGRGRHARLEVAERPSDRPGPDWQVEIEHGRVEMRSGRGELTIEVLDRSAARDLLVRLASAAASIQGGD